MSTNTEAQLAPDDSISIFSAYKTDFVSREPESMSLGKFMALCKTDKLAYGSWADRLLDAIGEPEIVDTANDKGPLGRIFQGRTIARYSAFSDFFGAEETIQKIVAHIRGAADGTEYKKQVLYLLGPVGGGKSSLGERIKELMEKHPIYVLRDKRTGQLSPIQESPLGLFDNPKMRGMASEKLGIPERYMKTGMSPWAVARLKEAEGDMEAAFDVVKVYPSAKNKMAIAKIEPGDDNNQDTTVLVGKVDINKLGDGIPQSHTDCYAYSGGLSIGHQGVLEFVEMFKAPLKVLNPLLEATQSGHYTGTENIGVIPFSGLIFAHSNESEWRKFAGNKQNEAILNRINVIEVPYTMRVTEEAKIYQKMLVGSALAARPIAPRTIDLLAKFSVMSRLSTAAAVAKYAPDIRAQVYDGAIPEGAKSAVPTIGELRKLTPRDEGKSGFSVRSAFKVTTDTFNSRVNDGEIAADPVLMMEVLESFIRSDGTIADADKDRYISLIREHVLPEYAAFIKEEITMAFTGANDEMCQGMFDRYISMADAWVNGDEFNDKGVTGGVLNKDDLEKKLAELEKPAGIVNGKDFRYEVTRYVMRKERSGEKVRWDSYEKMASVIRQSLQKKMKDVMPVIKFDATGDEKSAEKREQFIANMTAKGYTLPMIKRAVGVYEATLG